MTFLSFSESEKISEYEKKVGELGNIINIAAKREWCRGEETESYFVFFLIRQFFATAAPLL